MITISKIKLQNRDLMLKQIHPEVVSLLQGNQLDMRTAVSTTNLYPADILLYNNNAAELIESIIKYKITNDNIASYFSISHFTAFHNLVYKTIILSSPSIYFEILGKNIPTLTVEENIILYDFIQSFEKKGLLLDAMREYVSMILLYYGLDKYKELIIKSKIYLDNQRFFNHDLIFFSMIKNQWETISNQNYREVALLLRSVVSGGWFHSPSTMNDIRWLEKLINTPDVFDKMLERFYDNYAKNYHLQDIFIAGSKVKLRNNIEELILRFKKEIEDEKDCLFNSRLIQERISNIKHLHSDN